MTNTPDEIKKGLGDPVPVHFHVGNPEPHLTPLAYRTLEELFADALAYIQQLEAERDAAVEIIKKKVGCEACKCYGLCTVPLPDCGECVHENCPCHTCCGRSNWQWRGVQKEE